MNNLPQAPHSDSFDTDPSSAPVGPSNKLLVAATVAVCIGFILTIASIVLFPAPVGDSVLGMTGGICLVLIGFVLADRLSVFSGKLIVVEGVLFFFVGVAILLKFIGVIDLVIASFR